MSIRIERKQQKILLWDSIGTAPLIVEHDEAVELAQEILDMAGHMKQEQNEEAA